MTMTAGNAVCVDANGLVVPLTESGEEADGRDQAGSTGVDIGETGQDTGYADLGSADLDGDVDDTQGKGNRAPMPSRTEQLEAAIGQPLRGADQPTDDRELATPTGDDTDEDGERVDTSDIGYEIPTGGKEPAA